MVSGERWNSVTCSVGLQRPSIWPQSAMLAITAHKSLPVGSTPHLNNNATKEYYTHERDERKGGNGPMEQNWEEEESCKGAGFIELFRGLAFLNLALDDNGCDIVTLVTVRMVVTSVHRNIKQSGHWDTCDGCDTSFLMVVSSGDAGGERPRWVRRFLTRGRLVVPQEEYSIYSRSKQGVNEVTSERPYLRVGEHCLGWISIFKHSNPYFALAICGISETSN